VACPLLGSVGESAKQLESNFLTSLNFAAKFGRFSSGQVGQIPTTVAAADALDAFALFSRGSTPSLAPPRRKEKKRERREQIAKLSCTCTSWEQLLLIWQFFRSFFNFFVSEHLYRTAPRLIEI
jgi:hypothetical protein